MSTWTAVLLTLAAMAPLGGKPADTGPGLRASGPAEVVYVDNEGFLLLLDGRKILVDGLYEMADPEHPPAAIRDRIVNARPPFDDVDLVLATHTHFDHFGPRAVAAYLRRTPKAVFVGPPQTVQQLKDSVPDLGPLEARIRTVDVPLGESAEMEVAGIRIVVMSSPHSGDDTETQNYMYLLDWNGFKAFHEGDAINTESLAPWGLAGQGIDVAFFHWGRLIRPGGMGLVEETVGAQTYIPMHFAYTGAPALAARIPEMIQDFPKVHYLQHPLERLALSPSPGGSP